MTKFATSATIDGGLDKLTTFTTQALCAGFPTNFADIATRKLASTSLSGVDFTKSNNTPTGRKVVINEKLDVLITASGTADHCVIHNGVDYYVTECSPLALVADGVSTVDIPNWNISVSAPT